MKIIFYILFFLQVQCIANQAFSLVIPTVFFVYLDRLNNLVTKNDFNKFKSDLINQLKNNKDLDSLNFACELVDKKQEVVQKYDKIIDGLTISSIILYLLNKKTFNLTQYAKSLNTSLNITSCILIWIAFFRCIHKEYLSNLIKTEKNVSHEL